MKPIYVNESLYTELQTLPERLRPWVIRFIFVAANDGYWSCSIHQKLLELLVGCNGRKHIIGWFKRSAHWTVGRSYMPGTTAKKYYLDSQAVTSQHNNGRPGWVPLSLPDGWIDESEHMFSDACCTLGWSCQWRDDLIFSLDSIQPVELPESVMQEKIDEKVNQGNARPDVESAYRSSWERINTDRLEGITRIHGRCYHALTNAPKWMRHWIQVRYRGQVEEIVEIDMSSTYWAILASAIRDRGTRNYVIQSLQDGTFYEKIAAHAKHQYTDRSKLKQDVNKNCLFAKQGFGTTPLFRALKSLYPDLARLINWWRRKDHGASLLSHALTLREGRFFIDGALRQFVSRGIPVIPIHDALLVPASEAEFCLQAMTALARSEFGFVPKFKVEYLA